MKGLEYVDNNLNYRNKIGEELT